MIVVDASAALEVRLRTPAARAVESRLVDASPDVAAAPFVVSQAGDVLRATNPRRADLSNCFAKKNNSERNNQALFQSPKRQSEYRGYRAIMADHAGNAMPILIGAGLIAAAILLSTLITAVGTRF